MIKLILLILFIFQFTVYSQNQSVVSINSGAIYFNNGSTQIVGSVGQTIINYPDTTKNNSTGLGFAYLVPDSTKLSNNGGAYLSTINYYDMNVDFFNSFTLPLSITINQSDTIKPDSKVYLILTYKSNFIIPDMQKNDSYFKKGYHTVLYDSNKIRNDSIAFQFFSNSQFGPIGGNLFYIAALGETDTVYIKISYDTLSHDKNQEGIYLNDLTNKIFKITGKKSCPGDPNQTRFVTGSSTNIKLNSIYPVPSNYELKVDYYIPEIDEIQYIISNEKGDKMMSNSILPLNAENNTSLLNISKLNPGVYMITLYYKNSFVNQKFNVVR